MLPSDTVAAGNSAKADGPELLLYRNGRPLSITRESSSHFAALLSAGEELFLNADSSYRLIMSPDRIEQLKRNETVLEIAYPAVQIAKIQGRHTAYYGKLLIPLTGQFANGTVFFAGAWALEPGTRPSDTSAALQYGALTFVLNTRGLKQLKDALREARLISDS